MKSSTCNDVTTVTTYSQPIRAGVSRGVVGKVRESEVTEVTGGNSKKLRVGVNDAGRRVGESHQNAKLSDEDVRMILELHSYHGIGYKKLATKFEVSRRLIQLICQGKRRGNAPVKYR